MQIHKYFFNDSLHFVHFQALLNDLGQDSSTSCGLYALYSHTLVKLIHVF